ncbi:MAG: HAD family hydrolase [Erysipelotrichaceae bacterium]|nr:HAD family hydrolase [Erysipelotrichaceae bacterium]
MNYTHIVFDIDGTLLDNAEALITSLQEVMMEEVGRLIPKEELAFSMGMTGEDTLRRLQVKDVEHSMKRWIELLANYNHLVKVYDGIEELLKELKRQGCHLGIVSSKPREVYKNDFAPLPIAAYFETVVCADDTTEHKPNAAPLLKYMELTGAKAEEIFYVGDSDYDRQCAYNADIEFAAAAWNPKVAAITLMQLREPNDLFDYVYEEIM